MTHIAEFAQHMVQARGPQPVGVILAAFANAGNAIDRDALTEEIKGAEGLAIDNAGLVSLKTA